MTKQDTHEKLGQIYPQEQKQGMVEIFVTLRLPVNIYETAAGLYRNADYKSFDDYVSHCVVNDIEMMNQRKVADDLIISKITKKSSPWMQNQKEFWNKINKNLKRSKKTHCECGEALEGYDMCPECGRINK